MFMNANKDMLDGNGDTNDSYPGADLSNLDAG